MRVLSAFTCAVLAAFGFAQTPDVIIAVDARPTFLGGDGRNAFLRWFDAYANPSTVGFKFRLDNGNRIAVTQRLARQGGSGDPDSTEEFSIESPGEWKLGKQTLPFGQRKLLRETALAIRLQTNLVFEEAPLDFALVDAGEGRPQGVIGRIGDNNGVSFAFGEHFAIQDTAFTILRRDPAGIGKGRGYKTILGADAVLFKYPLTAEAEVITLREGHTAQDLDQTISDVRVSYQFPNGRDMVTLAWARQWHHGVVDSFRLDAEFVLVKQVVLMPHIRIGSRGLNQFGTTVRVRL